MVAAITLITLGIALVAYHVPSETGELGVIFPPWTAQSVAFAAVVGAGGAITNTGRFSNVVIVRADDADFTQRVLARGAWIVTAARGLCAPQQEIA